ncbi:MAG TPA: hypothetical protein VM866_08115, partial [Pyrinomonadaceae bacterium]|nr:hypothetical protein [Pyrinomonadaceae bacterium]
LPLLSFFSLFLFLTSTSQQRHLSPRPRVPASPRLRVSEAPHRFEYLWYEAENMRGISTDARHEPRLNPSWKNLSRAESPGWGINGPGVSAEWTQGGESEWNSVAASADETRAVIYQDVEVPREGPYKIWVRYADWVRRNETFAVSITQGGRGVFRHKFGVRDVVDEHDEVAMYWGWAFVWDGAVIQSLTKGAARISIEIESPAEARRHVDCALLTNDTAHVPDGRRKPPFAGMNHLEGWGKSRTPFTSLISADTDWRVPGAWRRPLVAGRDFLMPWNIAPQFWDLSDKPPAERPLYPFHAEPIDEFVAKYKGARAVPIFDSKLVVPVIYINDLPRLLKEGSAFLRYLRETRAPFAVLINYGSAQMSESEGRAAWSLLTGELREQFIGWISGESIGYVWDQAAENLKLSPAMSRRELLEAHRVFYTRALERKWGTLFHTPTGAMWDKLIPAQATSTTAYAHALGRWGTKLTGMETAAVQPMTAMRIAFVRGAARQHGSAFLYYHAPNFGDTATTFTKEQNFAGPDHFFHTRYGATMGPSLSWYRKSYYLYYMAGASAMYLEQGFDQFFKPGPGEHPYQLNPLGRITEEFIRFAERHPERGTPYTPVAFLLDPAHGFEMTDYPQWPFGVSQINRSDRALRELFGTAYFPGTVVEGEPASGDRQAFVNGVFGDIFDVLVASEERAEAIDSYRAVVVGGSVEWGRGWGERLKNYVRNGGTVFVNAAQAKGLSPELLGVRLTGESLEAEDGRCLEPGETGNDLSGQVFRYERIEPRGARVMIQTSGGDALVTINRIGRGQIILCAIPDLLGLDERMTPVAAHVLTHLFAGASPVRVKGEVEHLINRTPRGWVVTLFNNFGVNKPQQGMAQVNRSAVVDVELYLTDHGIERAQEWTTDETLNVTRGAKGESIKLRVPPSGVRIVEVLTRH